MKKIWKKTDIGQVAEYLYLAVLGLYLLKISFDTTMFYIPWPRDYDMVLFIITSGVVMLKIGCSSRQQGLRWFFCALLGIVFGLSWWHTQYYYLFLLYIPALLIGAMDVDYRKILGVSFWCNFSTLALAFIGSCAGVVRDLSYKADAGHRHSFGIVYTTDFSARVFYLLLVAWVLYENMHIVVRLLLAAFSLGFIAFFCQSKCSEITLFLLIVLLLYEFFTQKEKISEKLPVRVLDHLMVWCAPVCAVCVLCLSLFYNENTEWMTALDGMLTQRLSLSNKAIGQYGFTFFGTAFAQQGLGGTTAYNFFYNFVDSSYVLILLRYGTGVFLATMALTVYQGRTALKKGKRKLMLAMTLVAVHSIVEHHMPEINYNIFLILPFAAFGPLTEKAGATGRKKSADAVGESDGEKLAGAVSESDGESPAGAVEASGREKQAGTMEASGREMLADAVGESGREKPVGAVGECGREKPAGAMEASGREKSADGVQSSEKNGKLLRRAGWVKYLLAAAGIGLLLLAAPSLIRYARTLVHLLKYNEFENNKYFIVWCFIVVAAAAILMYNVWKVLLYREKRKKAVLRVVWMTLSAAVILSVAVISGRILRDGMEGYSPVIRSERQILEDIMESCGGETAFYVSDVPALYKKEISTVDDRILPVEACDLEKGSVVLVTSIDKDLINLFQAGYYFGILSESHGIYTNNSDVIRRLEELGIGMTDYYSVFRPVDMFAVAANNQLEITEDGSLFLSGKERAVSHGPWFTLSRGKYVIEFEIQLTRADSYELGHARVTSDNGMTWWEGKDFTWADFDENAHGTIRFEIDFWCDVNNVEFLIFPNDEIDMYVSRIECRKVGRSGE